jgi:hypothetical protein
MEMTDEFAHLIRHFQLVLKSHHSTLRKPLTR